MQWKWDFRGDLKEARWGQLRGSSVRKQGDPLQEKQANTTMGLAAPGQTRAERGGIREDLGGNHKKLRCSGEGEPGQRRIHSGDGSRCRGDGRSCADRRERRGCQEPREEDAAAVRMGGLGAVWMERKGQGLGIVRRKQQQDLDASQM